MKRFKLLSLLLLLASTICMAQEKLVLKAGTIIPLKADQQVKAAEVEEGETVNFRVAQDIKIGDKVILKNGHLVKGTVRVAKKSTIAGTKGRLVIDIPYIIQENGEYINLSNTTVRINGKNRTPLAVITACFVWPCIFITGTKAVMPIGYSIDATVSHNIEYTF